MQLKRYQERVIREVRSFLDVLVLELKADNRHASLDAWDQTKKLISLRGEYVPRKNGLGRDLPTFCIKVPTGGGKTLLATQVLGAIYQTILKDRNGTGLVLWVVPSDQIYKDTLKALRDRRHFYRESLEFALSRRIEVWEKQEIARLTPAQLRSNPDTNYKRSVANYFEKVGRKVPWQKLGKDFKDEQFRFQILDEGDTNAKDWKDTLRQVLAGYRV